MIDLSTVVTIINERGLKLFRTADTLRIEGDCPPEMAQAIRTHRTTLLPFAAIDPAAAEQVAEQQAAANGNTVKRQWDEFAEWVQQKHPIAAYDHSRRSRDRRLVAAADTQKPTEVAAMIVELKEELDALEWASHLFPLATEAGGEKSWRNIE